mgnify:CR=1 FL=1
MRPIATVGLATALLLPAAHAGAASLRCDGYLINEGDSCAEFVDSCGSPDQFRPLFANGQAVGAEVILRPGPGKARRRVVFDEHKRVADIDLAD